MEFLGVNVQNEKKISWLLLPQCVKAMTNVPTEIHKMEEKSQGIDRSEQLRQTQRRRVTV